MELAKKIPSGDIQWPLSETGHDISRNCIGILQRVDVIRTGILQAIQSKPLRDSKDQEARVHTIQEPASWILPISRISLGSRYHREWHRELPVYIGGDNVFHPWWQNDQSSRCWWAMRSPYGVKSCRKAFERNMRDVKRGMADQNMHWRLPLVLWHLVRYQQLSKCNH